MSSIVGGNKSPLASPLRKKKSINNTNTNNTTTKIRKKKKNQPSQQLTKHDVEMKGAVDEEIHTDTTNNTSDDTTQLNNTSYGMGMGGMNSMMMSPYSMGMGGMGMMGGMYGGMYGGMGMGMGSQWLTSLNQCLFGFQSLIFSLGQAVQIVGMNAQQLHHVYDSIKGMIENVLGQVNSKLGCSIEELLGVKNSNKQGKNGSLRGMLGNNENSTSTEDGEGEDEIITQNEIIRRRRVAAFRWTISLATSYLLYKGVRKLIRTLIFGGGDSHRHSSIQQQQQYQGSNGYGQYGSGMSSGYSNGGYGMSRYNSGYGGGRGYGQRQYYDQGGYSDIDRGDYY